MVEEDEIDLRPYIMSVLRHWKVVVGVTVLFVAIAAVVSLTTPVTYEASSTVAIAAPGAQPTPAAKSYLDLATGDKVVAALAKDLGGSTGRPALPEAELKSKLTAVQGTDPSQITLEVRDTSPDRASRIAGTWATAFVAASNATFNNTQDTLKQLESQSKAAETQLSRAEADLTAQERRDSVTVLQAQVAAQQDSLTSLYGTRSSLQAAAAQTNSLRSRLRQLDPNSSSSPGDDLAILQLQLTVLNAQAQVQVPGVLAPSGRTVGAQVSYLNGLTVFINDKAAETDQQIAAAQVAVLDLQGRLQQATDQEVPLVARCDNARQMIKDLDLKAAQAKTAAEVGTNQARVVAEPAVPAVALSRGMTKDISIGVVLGIAAGVVVAYGLEFLGKRRGGVVQGFGASAGQVMNDSRGD